MIRWYFLKVEGRWAWIPYWMLMIYLRWVAWKRPNQLVEVRVEEHRW